jgi:large subunit ribosomal protein L7/L12
MSTEDKTHVVKFDVLLVKSGENKVQMMGIIMDLTGWGLKQSKDLIDEPPGMVLQGVSHSKAMEAVKRLEAVGADAVVQRVLK